jgi:hypothetical protein
MTENIFAPGPTPNSVRTADGKVLTAPEGWILLPPGDAALTRQVKAAGEHWVVQEKKGRKVFPRGIWAAAATIERIRAELEAERSTEKYAKRKEADAQRREKAQNEYVDDFFQAVVAFLAFHPKHADLAERLARAVTDHATPVGRGTASKRATFQKRIGVTQDLSNPGAYSQEAAVCYSKPDRLGLAGHDSSAYNQKFRSSLRREEGI